MEAIGEMLTKCSILGRGKYQIGFLFFQKETSEQH